MGTVFHRWWTLGQRVTISPLEVAKAFDPEILCSSGFNETVKELLKKIEPNSILYGVSDVGVDLEDEIGYHGSALQKVVMGKSSSLSSSIHGTVFVEKIKKIKVICVIPRIRN